LTEIKQRAHAIINFVSFQQQAFSQDIQGKLMKIETMIS